MKNFQKMLKIENLPKSTKNTNFMQNMNFGKNLNFFFFSPWKTTCCFLHRVKKRHVVSVEDGLLLNVIRHVVLHCNVQNNMSFLLNDSSFCWWNNTLFMPKMTKQHVIQTRLLQLIFSTNRPVLLRFDPKTQNVGPMKMAFHTPKLVFLNPKMLENPYLNDS